MRLVRTLTFSTYLVGNLFVAKRRCRRRRRGLFCSRYNIVQAQVCLCGFLVLLAVLCVVVNTL